MRVPSRTVGLTEATTKVRSPHRPPRSATTQRFRMISVVVAAGMDHQRLALDLIQLLDARSQHRVVRRAVLVHIQRRQIAQMTITSGASMLTRPPGIEMTAG